MTARTRTDALLLAGFCAFLFFYGTSQFGLIGADEPRYAQVAREMLERRDWITPTLGGHAWLEKPPLYYWQAMLAYSIVGVSDTAARIPSAVDATFLVIAVYLFFRKFRRGVEVDAALITASCAGVIGFARAASMDMGLAATFAMGLLAWWAWRERGRRFYLGGFYFCMALGMLAKGPVAPFLAALILGAFAAASREWRLLLKTLWLPGVALFLVTSMPWYFAVQMRNPQFFREFIVEHNLARFSSNLYHHPEPFWYYLPVVVVALVPWVVFVVVALVESARAGWTRRQSAGSEPDLELQFRVFASCWLVVPVLFFSISRSKLPGYILPAIPAGAALLADYLLRQLELKDPVSKWMAVLHALVASGPLVPAVLIGFIVTARRFPGGRPIVFPLTLMLLLAIAISATLVSHYRLRMLRFVTLIPVVLAVAAVLKLGTTAIDQKLSIRPLAVELASVETTKLPLAVYGSPREVEYGLAFYRNQIIDHYQPGSIPAGEHLLVAPTTWMDNVAKETAGRRVLFLGHYAAQGLDYYWVSAAGVKP
jgi:4-amino-4-deoxy-L-arabinose transferase-like glycosyltransferase